MTTRLPFAGLLGGSLLLAASLAPSAQAQTTLNMSSWVPPTHFLVTDILEPWMADIEKATEGRVKIKILPKPVGSPPQHFELARKGVADITWGNFTYEPDRFKSLWFAELPFAGANGEAAGAALWQTYEKYLADNPAFAGVKMLGVGMLGGGSIHHGSKAIVEPDDLNNQKIRMGGPIQKRLLEDLGAIPIADAAPKAYELLESGVIDGSLHSLESVINFRVEDKLKYHTMVPDGFYDGTFFIVMNERKWNRLSEADREAIMSVSGEVLSRRWGAQFDAQNKAAQEKLTAEGHTFSTPSPALLDKISQVRDGILADWEKDAGNFGVSDAQGMVEFYQQHYKQNVGQ
ncbi:MAG: TRAP transporter substrate-binding protein [Candidatus Competibacteraceae bacterium]|nr:TRAP transporter substrate-binding protein [Candidatus Competibacteraceae bacterium]MCB1810616.1 TRAP transporter substrate-binding protein [Candidatus Competibacteraceae bacterium]